MNSHLRWSSASPGCADASSPGSSGTAAPSPGVIQAGRLTRSSSRKSCCRGLPQPGFIERYPSWATLAQAPPNGLENTLRPLGLWRQKALAFQYLAQSVEEHGGIIPRTRAELERLRGIGPYTASAVLAIVYGRAEALLDVNMTRVLGRFLGSPGPAEAGAKGPLHAFALRLVSGKRSLEIN